MFVLNGFAEVANEARWKALKAHPNGVRALRVEVEGSA